jgi:hypothetical protein
MLDKGNNILVIAPEIHEDKEFGSVETKLLAGKQLNHIALHILH